MTRIERISHRQVEVEHVQTVYKDGNDSDADDDYLPENGVGISRFKQDSHVYITQLRATFDGVPHELWPVPHEVDKNLLLPCKHYDYVVPEKEEIVVLVQLHHADRKAGPSDHPVRVILEFLICQNKESHEADNGSSN